MFDEVLRDVSHKMHIVGYGICSGVPQGECQPGPMPDMSMSKG